MRPTRVYVASSWRNDAQPHVVKYLRDLNAEVYDFKNPGKATNGFHWSEVMPSFDSKAQVCDQKDYLVALDHERSKEGFNSDFNAMQWADCCVLVLPCGRSAHLELGWFVGIGKPTAIILDGPKVTPELMYRMVSHIATDVNHLREWFTPTWPQSLMDAVRLASKRMTGQVDGAEVHDQIRKMFGPGAFPYVSTLDVVGCLREFYG